MDIRVIKNSKNNVILTENFSYANIIRFGDIYYDGDDKILINDFGVFKLITGDPTTIEYTPTTNFTGAANVVVIEYENMGPGIYNEITRIRISITVTDGPTITQGLPEAFQIKKTEQKIINVAASEATKYTWYIDDILKQTGVTTSYTLDGSDSGFVLGDTYTLKLEVEDNNGNKVTRSVIFTIITDNIPVVPSNIIVQLESLTNIKVSWSSSDIVQYTFDPTDNSTFVSAPDSFVNIPIIVEGSFNPTIITLLKPQYSKIRLRAINANEASISVTQDISMPYTIEKKSNINFEGGVTDRYIITEFNNATEEISIINGITAIDFRIDTTGDRSIRTITKHIIIPSSLSGIGGEAFNNCSALERITCLGMPPTENIFNNVSSTSYWNFAPIRQSNKVKIFYDSSIAAWDPIVKRSDPISPYIEFSGEPYIYENLPSTATIKINTPYLLVAKVYGSPIAYQWYRNGVVIEGATSSSYTVNESAYDTTVSYSYKASNNRGEQTSQIAITFVAAPTINNPLEGQTILALLDASSQTITMDVVGTALITYEWSINGSILSEQTSNELTLTGAMLTQLGTNMLSFKATNIYGSVSSSTTITKVAPPTITASPNINLTSGSGSSTVEASGSGPFTYEWKNSEGDTVGTEATLTRNIIDFTEAGDYTYSVTVTNPYGSNSRTITVSVRKPTITAVPNIQLSGASGSSTVEASGTGPFTYLWKNSAGNTVGTNATLTLNNTDFDTAGNYTYSVTVTNAVGSDSRTITATVVKQPSNQILSFVANYGSILTESYTNTGNRPYIRIATPGDVIFTVEVTGYPQQKVEWLVASVDLYINKESTPVVVKTTTTTKQITQKETFTYTRTYGTTPDVNEVIYVRVTNNGASSEAISSKIYIDTPPVLKTGSYIYYADSYIKRSALEWERDQFVNTYTSTQKYMLLYTDISILNRLMIGNYDQYITFYIKNCLFTWEYKGLTDTSYKLLDLTADYIITADTITNPFMIVIDREKFPLLTQLGTSCTFRCTVAYKNPSIIGSAVNVKEVTTTILNYELNANGELVKLPISGNKITIPAEVTKIAENFVIRSMGLDIVTFYTGNARRVNQVDREDSNKLLKINVLGQIKTIKLHKNITFIGENAFGYNEFRWQFPSQTTTSLLPNLTSIEGMPTDATVEKDAFANCPQLEQVLFDSI